MQLRDFFLMLAICAAWAVNTAITNFAVGENSLTQAGVPPLLYAALRFVIVALATVRWLRPLPASPLRLAAVALIMGIGHFGLTIVGLRDASTASAGIIILSGSPLTVLLSVVFLGERMTRTRVAGLALTLGGVMAVMPEPGGMRPSFGMLYLLGGQIAFALASVLMKRLTNIGAVQFQAWVAVLSVPPLLAGSAMLESDHVGRLLDGGWPLLAMLIFSGLIASLWAQSSFFKLLQQHDGSLIGPLTLMAPLLTISIGVIVRQDPFSWRLALGACAALVGVLITMLGDRRRARRTNAEPIETNVAT
ncbi:MAG: DMT family transporter [Sphingobium sp.]